MRLHDKAARLRQQLREYGRVGVAFSGGADSSLLLRAASDALGAENVVALHARSCLQTQEERERAQSWPQRQGCAVRLQILDLEPLTWPDFTANPPEERCYLCKRRIYSRFLELLAAEGIAALLDGTNADDLQADRPGLRAIAELAGQTPLADCGLSKADVRELSRELGLDTWNQPSASCLATRLPAGMTITAERLAQIAAMEQTLAEAGFSGCRARLLDEKTVCLQLAEKDMRRLAVLADLRNLRGQLRSASAEKIFLDLDGR